MLCTLNTDASFHPKYKVGAYAFWSVCNTFKLKRASVFKEPFVKSSVEAELKCILNAITLTLRQDKSISSLVVNTDCLNAIHVLKDDRKMVRKYRLQHYKKYRQKYNKICSKYRRKSGVNIKKNNCFRHVKAHSDVDDKRSYVNEWCDFSAKKCMWEYVNNNLK